MKFADVKKYFDGRYNNASSEMTLTIDDKDVNGIMYGDNECWDVNDFYQYFIVDGKNGASIYYAYYSTGSTDVDNEDYIAIDEIDYDDPDYIVDVTDRYASII